MADIGARNIFAPVTSTSSGTPAPSTIDSAKKRTFAAAANFSTPPLAGIGIWDRSARRWITAATGGQILAQGPGQRRYVFDVSAAEPVEGVNRLRHEAELAGLDVDLLLLCEVLEHASAPVELLRKLVSCLRPGSLLFVTVPHEQVPIADIPDAPWYRAYLRMLVKWKPLLTLGDFYSTAFRVKFGRIPPFGFAKMHEHLNFFSAKSLGLALNRSGFNVLECGLASPAGPLVAVAAHRA
jgi:SAM-dependent methyltransferase